MLLTNTSLTPVIVTLIPTRVVVGGQKHVAAEVFVALMEHVRIGS